MNFHLKTILLQSVMLLICSNAFAQEPQSDSFVRKRIPFSILEKPKTDPIKEHIYDIHYVFEGVIDSVELYPGDSIGNRIPIKILDKPNSFKTLINESGGAALVYSLSRIIVSKVYKGTELEGKDTVFLFLPLPESQLYDDFGRITRMRPPVVYHGEQYPSPPFKSKNVFFCKKNALGYLEFYSYNKGVIICFNPWKNTERDVYAYTPIGDLHSQEEVDSYLKTLPTLKKNPQSKCTIPSSK